MLTLLDIGKINNPITSLRPLLVCILGLALLTVACETAPTRQSSSSDTANLSGEKVATVKEKLVCRREERTGSHFKTSICKYQREWDAIDEVELRSSAEYMRKTDDRSAVTSGTGPGGDAYSGQGMTPTSQ